MRIPEEATARRAFYAKLLRECTTSREDRYQFNTTLRNYYLFGTKDTAGCDYNKIAATVDTLWSFMYAADTAKFAMHLGTSSNDGDLAKVPALVAEINDQWRASRSNLIFSLAGKWSLVYGAMLFKTLWHRGQAKSFYIEPHQFGVLREDVMELDDQEAFVHTYTVTRTQLENQLEGHPRKDAIIASVGQSPTRESDEATMGEGLGRLILSSGVGTGIGPAIGGGSIEGGIGAVAGGMYDYRPQVEVELIELNELWVWNDAISDYQVVTIAAPDMVIFDRKNFFIPETHPFNKLMPEHDTYDYFWGASFVARLTGLQDWRDQRMRQLRELLEKQVDPPMWGVGLTGIAEEKFQAMGRAGGRLSASQPNAKIEAIAPSMPGNAFAEIQEIDSMFSDAAGISAILQGHGAAGVRSHGQADLMARLGSSRVKQKALVVEETASRLGTLMLRTVQTYSDQRFTSEEHGPDKKPLTFVAEQFTTDYEVKVDSHSSSPVFVEDQRETAIMLLKAKAIDRSAFIEMIDPPNKQLLLAQLKDIEKREAQAQKMQLQLAQEKVQSKAPH
jgi:hypothetical protein